MKLRVIRKCREGRDSLHSDIVTQFFKCTRPSINRPSTCDNVRVHVVKCVYMRCFQQIPIFKNEANCIIITQVNNKTKLSLVSFDVCVLKSVFCQFVLKLV